MVVGKMQVERLGIGFGVRSRLEREREGRRDVEKPRWIASVFVCIHVYLSVCIFSCVYSGMWEGRWGYMEWIERSLQVSVGGG